MTSISNDDIELAFRKRIRSQALYHLIGKPLPTIVGARFQAAGVWEWSIPTQLPPQITVPLMNPHDPRRLQIACGPLAAIEDGENKVCHVVDTAELFISSDRELRAAAVSNFESLDERGKRWTSSFVADLIASNHQTLLDDDNPDWRVVGLKIHDAIRDDLRISFAGLRQATELDYSLSYTMYMQRVLRPSFASIATFGPPLFDPYNEKDQTNEMINAWLSNSTSLGELLDNYVEHCGYLPLSGDLTAGRILSRWLEDHAVDNVWRDLWEWADGRESLICFFHTCCALVEHPEWVPHDAERLYRTIERLTSSNGAEDCEDELVLGGRLRNALQRYFQFHLESLAPGMNSQILAVYAYWLANQVALHYGGDPTDIKGGISVVEFQLDIAMRRWCVARSRTEPCLIRNVTLFSPFAWSGSLLLLITQHWKKIGVRFDPTLSESTIGELRRLLMTSVIPVKSASKPTYMFEIGVCLDDLDLTLEPPTADNPMEPLKGLILANEKCFADDSLPELFEGLRSGNSDFACYSAFALRSRQFSFGIRTLPADTLESEEWRRGVFAALPDSALDAFLMFLTEWQMQQDGEWVIKLPHLLVIEAERTATEQPQLYLSTAVLTTSLAAEISSPIVRLLTGSHGVAFRAQLELWIKQLRLVSDLSEPWLANRLRGMRGSIDALMQ